jgi:hypothetical protein
MKVQYFTDEHDFFKWDFLKDILDASPELKRFTNLAMLTPPDASGEGSRNRYPCSNRRQALYDFLQECRDGKRAVTELARYYSHKRFTYWQHAGPYTWEDHEAYFDTIPDECLEEALIFFDPDIGLEWGGHSYMREQGIEKYVFDDSVRAIARRSKRAIIVVYQHLQRDKGRSLADAQERCRRLHRLVATDFSVLLSDGEIGFLAATTDSELRGKLCEAVLAHAGKHGIHCAGHAKKDVPPSNLGNAAAIPVLAKPARALRTPRLCACGCGGQTQRTWCPGHDAIAASAAKRAARELGADATAEALQQRTSAILAARRAEQG